MDCSLWWGKGIQSFYVILTQVLRGKIMSHFLTRFLLLSSHTTPKNPSPHIQTKASTLTLIQEPPFSHGELLHASRGTRKQIWPNMVSILYSLILKLFVCEHTVNSLRWQICPKNPSLHKPMKLSTSTSMQVPPLSRGELLHASSGAEI